jgi:hypothetical protein
MIHVREGVILKDLLEGYSNAITRMLTGINKCGLHGFCHDCLHQV